MSDRTGSVAAGDDVRLRPLLPADVPAVAELNDAEVPRVSPLGASGLHALLPRCDLAVLAEDASGRLAGFVMAIAPGEAYASVNYGWFEARGTDHLYVDRIVTAASHRRRGVGGRLSAAVEERARATGRAEVTCEVNVRPRNDASLALHAALGFVEVGRQDTTGGTITVALLARPVR